jgi:hypothetical protein
MVRNGRNASRKPKYLCKDGEANQRFATPRGQKDLIVRTDLERGRMRGIQRRFGFFRPTRIPWIKKSAQPAGLEGRAG